MRLNNSTTLVETANLKNQHKFQISTNDTAFQILSSGLYSDKVMAVIRELCCNAYDANVAAGNGNIPFVVTLPTEKNTTFKVTDLGPGLDDSQIISLYTTYFASDKRNTNQQIGGFGLGSKSPFAYTDSFTVCSKKDGVSRTYTAYLTDDGPTITLLGESSTDEKNGVEVSMMVKTKDIEEFVKKTELFMAWFQKPVTLVNHNKVYNTYVRDYSYETKRLKLPSTKNNTYQKLSNHYSYDSIPLVVMGGVCYPLNIELVAKHNKLHHDFLKVCPELHMPIGSVKVAASREELQYDKTSVETLSMMLDEEIENFKEYLTELSKKGTWAAKVEASTTVRSLRHNHVMFALLKNHFSKLYPFIESHTEKMPKKAYDQRVLMSIYDKRWQSASIIRDGELTQNGRKSTVEVKKETGSSIFLNDLGAEKELLMSYKDGLTSEQYNVIYITANKKDLPIAIQTAEELSEAMGGLPLIRASVYKEELIKQNKYKKKDKVVYEYVELDDRDVEVVSLKTGACSTIKLKDVNTTYYILKDTANSKASTNMWHMSDKDSQSLSNMQLDTVYAFTSRCSSLLPTLVLPENVVLLRPNDYKNLKIESRGWLPFLPYIIEELKTTAYSDYVNNIKSLYPEVSVSTTHSGSYLGWTTLLGELIEDYPKLESSLKTVYQDADILNDVMGFKKARVKYTGYRYNVPATGLHHTAVQAVKNVFNLLDSDKKLDIKEAYNYESELVTAHPALNGAKLWELAKTDGDAVIKLLRAVFSV